MTKWYNLTREDAKKLGIEGEYELMQLEDEDRKYNNEKPTVDGITFDSKKEARYYEKLKAFKKGGAVEDFELQPRFKLQKGFDDKEGNHHRPIHYRADFKIWWANGKVEIVDTKGYKTQVYKLKKKLLLKKYPDINFREV